MAARESVSVDEFVSAALADQLAGRRFIELRAKRFNREEFDRALAMIPDVEPEDFDGL